MKEIRDKWMENFRNRMDGYSEPVPEQLWEQLDKELGVPAKVPFYVRWQMAAAVAALLLISSLTVWFLQSPTVQYVEEVSKTLPNVPAQPDGLTKWNNEAETENAHTPMPMKQQRGRLTVYKTMSETNEALDANEEVAMVPSSETEVAAVAAENEKEVAKPEAKAAQTETTPKRSTNRSGYSFMASSQPKRRSWEVGLSVSNIPTTSNVRFSGYTSMPRPQMQSLRGESQMGDVQHSPASSSGGPFHSYINSESLLDDNSDVFLLNKIVFNNVRSTVDSEVKHHVPFTLGASVRFHLNEKWALETGLTYTNLSSDIRSGGDSDYYQIEQRLHYVGIPLKLSYQVWESNGLSLYASAGATAEKCVSGNKDVSYVVGGVMQTSGDEKLSIDPLQWSLNSSVGVQYKLVKQLGVYVEPGVSYYFKDGSDVQTIRKEHPLNFNLQLGVRLSY